MHFYIMTLFPEMVMGGLEDKYYRTCDKEWTAFHRSD